MISVVSRWLWAVCLLGLVGTAGQTASAKPGVEDALRTALDRCAAFLQGEIVPQDEELVTRAGPLSIVVLTEGGRQCKLFGSALEGDRASLTWAEGADMVADWMADQEAVTRATLRGWTLPITPVLGCGEVSVIAQPMRVFGADAPFSDAAPKNRPIEITLPAPQRLCDKYGAVTLKGITHA